MLRIQWLAICLFLSLVAADTVSAGIFGLGRRRWACRKAQLRAELEHELDKDLAREVDAITKKLTATAQDQVKSESEKLEQSV